MTQVALSIALLIGAGLMMRTMYALRHVPLGFRMDHLVLTSLTMPNNQYGDRNAGTAVWLPLLEEIRRMPGVRSAAMSTVLPIQHPVELITAVYATEWMQKDASAVVRAATPGLMEALGVRMRSGRFFADTDTPASLPVMVVNQAFVNRYLGGGNALGKVIRYGHVVRSATIVGVIDDIHQDSVAGASEPEFYLCLAQIGPDQQIYKALLGRVMQVAVRTEIAPGILIPELRRNIQLANRHLAIGECTTMAEAVEDSVGTQKLAAQILGVFGGLVLLITVDRALRAAELSCRTAHAGDWNSHGAWRGPAACCGHGPSPHADFVICWNTDRARVCIHLRALAAGLSIWSESAGSVHNRHRITRAADLWNAGSGCSRAARGERESCGCPAREWNVSLRLVRC